MTSQIALSEGEKVFLLAAKSGIFHGSSTVFPVYALTCIKRWRQIHFF